MFKVLKNEILKLFLFKRIYIVWAILGVMVLITAAVLRFSLEVGESSADAELLKAFSNGQSLPIVMLDGLASFVFPLFVVIITGFMISEEIGNGTIKLYLMHPVTRTQFIAAKLMAITVFNAIMLFFTMILSYIAGTLILGFGKNFAANTTFEGLFTAPVAEGLVITLLSYLLTILTLSAFGAIMLFIATKFSSSGITTAVGVGFLILLNLLMNMYLPVNDFFISGYFKFSNILMSESSLQRSAIGIGVLLFYTLLAYFITRIQFIKRDILN
ncbi:MAG: ABC transporter permease [Clostridiaceae bacterium]|nr:ABC transporter permease [Clostridiaceae bacterium]